MSWLFSQALVVEYSAGTSLAGAPSAQLNVMPTPHKFWRNDKTMEFSRLSQFGLTLQLLTVDHGVELLTSFLADFHAKTSAQPDLVRELPGGVEVDCGHSSSALLAKFDPITSTWKTAQCSLFEVLELSLETWPRWGSMRNGACYQRKIPALPICVSASGSWGRMWPTPCASASKGSSPASLTRKTGASRANDRIDHAVMASDSGQLNAEWVELVMGWPIGWTGLKPLGMDRFREWQQQHGNF